MQQTLNLGEVMALAAALSWAFAVILFKKSGEGIPPLALNLFKNTVAMLLLTPTVLLAGGALFPDVPLSTWLWLAASGLLGITLADTLFFWSLERLGAGLSAVVDTAYTPMVLGLSLVFLGEHLGSGDMLGAVLIVAALLVGSLTRPASNRSRSDLVLGTLAGLAAMLLMAVGVVMIKDLLDDLPLLWVTWVRLAAGSTGVMVAVSLHPRRMAMIRTLAPSPSWRWAIPASICGTYLAMMLWVGGMKYTLVSRAALLNQLSTIFIFVLATLLLHEKLTRRRVAAIALASAGALAIVY